jgi:uncharacterized protein YgiM (DUF1202 family)
MKPARRFRATLSHMQRWYSFLVSLAFLVGGSILFSGCNPFESKAGLQVITNDEPANVLLDGTSLTKTPMINKELKPGDYTLEIRPDDTNLAPYQTKISLKRGLLTVVAWKLGNRPETSGGVIYEMESLRNKRIGELSITTIPDGAIISVDGQAKGLAPVLVEQLEPKEYDYQVSLPSYETQKHQINVLAGYRMNVTVKLAKQEYTAGPTETNDTELSGAAALQASSAATLNSILASGSASPFSTKSAQSGQKPASASGTLAKPKVMIRPTHFFVNGQEVLRVRESAGSSGNELGFAPVGSEYPYSGSKLDGWYNITFNQKSGWVSVQFADLIE